MSYVVPTLPLSQLRLIAGIQDKKKRLLIIYIVPIYSIIRYARFVCFNDTFHKLRIVSFIDVCGLHTYIYINYNTHTSYYFSRAVHTRAAGAAAAYLEPTNERPSVSYVGNSCIRDIRVV